MNSMVSSKMYLYNKINEPEIYLICLCFIYLFLVFFPLFL